MAGLRDKAIGNHQVAERVEDAINLPIKRQPVLVRDPAQITRYRSSFPFQHQEKNQRRYGGYRRVNKTR